MLFVHDQVRILEAVLFPFLPVLFVSERERSERKYSERNEN
jgi:hypothetical protein